MLRTLALVAVLGTAVAAAFAPLALVHAEPAYAETAYAEPVRTEVVRHLSLKSAFPAKDTTLTSAPDAVRLWFSEATDLAATKIEVKHEGGAVVPTAALTRGSQAGAPVVAMFTTPPGNGRYVIDWRAMSKDGHVVKGTHAFTVRAAE